jgi:hypothetical protein
MTKFKTGHDPRRNTKGRPPSQSTEAIRQLVIDFVSDNITDLQECYNKLSGKEKLFYLDKILRYVLPPPQEELMKLTDDDLSRLAEKLKQSYSQNN